MSTPAKYIDLAAKIQEEATPAGVPIALEDVLEWLDQFAAEHPDQVPGRTITAGEVGRNAHLIRSVPIAGQVETPTIIDFLEALGITVVPEPTNAEKLDRIMNNRDQRFALLSMSLGEWLDSRGVRAPEAGGDDER